MSAWPYRFVMIRLAMCMLLVTVLCLPIQSGAAAQVEGDLVLAALEGSYFQPSLLTIHPGETVVYTIYIKNSTTANISDAQVNNPLPATLEISGSVSASTGTPGFANGVVTWTGTVNANSQVMVTYSATIKSTAAVEQSVKNTVSITGNRETLARDAWVTVKPYLLLLPSLSNTCNNQYVDTFSNPGSGWPIGDDEAALSDYLNGEYRIVNHTTYSPVFRGPGLASTDYTLSVKVTNRNGSAGSYGLVFGSSPNWMTHYSLEISENGWYSIYRADGENEVILTDGYSPAILQDNAPNLIQIERRGGSIKAYANGQLLDSITDNFYTGSRYVGITVYTNWEPDLDIRFDDFTLKPLVCN